jgi:hypothetical protein
MSFDASADRKTDTTIDTKTARLSCGEIAVPHCVTARDMANQAVSREFRARTVPVVGERGNSGAWRRFEVVVRLSVARLQWEA